MQDRTNIEEISVQLKQHRAQLDELNFAMYKSQDKETVFETIDRRFEKLVL